MRTYDTQADHSDSYHSPHSGQPTGKTIKVGQYETYVAEPKGKKHDGVALLYLTDIFGIWQNSQLMADQLAENGYHTIIIDVFNGDKFPNPPPADIMKWFAEGTNGDNPHTMEAVDPIVEVALKYLKEQGFTKIGALGYCFGAKVSRLSVLLTVHPAS
jgi:dienelactone hydrolase